MPIKINDESFMTLDDYIHDETKVDSAQLAQIEFEVELIGKLIMAREERGLSQRELAEISGVKQPAIARLESLKSTPKIDTLFKVLNPLGYKLDIVPIDNGEDSLFYSVDLAERLAKYEAGIAVERDIIETNKK